MKDDTKNNYDDIDGSTILFADCNNSDSRQEEKETIFPDTVLTESEKMFNIENELLNSTDSETRKNKPKKHDGFSKILPVILSIIVLIFVVAISVYCIVSDVLNSSNIVTNKANTPPQFQLNISDKPVPEQNYTNEDGTFTTEGLAVVVHTQIVEIYTYLNESDEIPSGSGSGIIISEDGYIVTNTHVLNGNEKFVVKTADNKTYNAQLKGRDAKTDIAVIKIQAHGLNPAQFGNSDQVVKGEKVAVIGNPAGLTGSITTGIVSGINRQIKTNSTGFQMNCIQTDAAISPGNSGGALVNMYGQVIGITSSKYATTTTEGLGFAITINDAKPIIEELITLGYVSGRVKIGIKFYTTYGGYNSVMFKEEFGFDIPKELENALWIESVSKDCDISNTELKSNDFILAVEGCTVSDYDQLNAAIKGKKGGDKISAKCARVDENGKINYFDIEFKLMSDTSGDY